MIVDFDHETICSDCHGGPSERRDHVRIPAGVRRIDDHRQMRNATNGWHGGQIERVTRVLGKRAHTSLAQDHIVIAFRHNVFGREQPFLKRCSHSALQQHGQLRATGPF